MRLVHWRKTMLFRLFALGMKLQLFGFRWQNFNFQITSLIILFLPLPPTRKRKEKPSSPFYIGACPVKNKKGTPCSLTLTGVPKKEKDTIFLLVWSAKFGGYDIEYPLLGQKNQSKITENFCGNPRSNAERVPQGKITGKKKTGSSGFSFAPNFWFPNRRSWKRPWDVAGAAAPANGEWELLGTNRIIKNTVGTFLLLYLPNHDKAKILFPSVLDGVAALLETFK